MLPFLVFAVVYVPGGPEVQPPTYVNLGRPALHVLRTAWMAHLGGAHLQVLQPPGILP